MAIQSSDIYDIPAGRFSSLIQLISLQSARRSLRELPNWLPNSRREDSRLIQSMANTSQIHHLKLMKEFLGDSKIN